MELALSFNEVIFTPIEYKEKFWIKATELANALGYADVSIVSRIFRKHEDEFTPDMTQVIEIAAEDRNGLPENLSNGRARIFSLRGCHLLSMFARTPVAKAFRKWVLDVLDKLAEEEAQNTQVAPELPIGADLPLTPDQQCTLRSIVKAKVEENGEDKKKRYSLYAQIWSRFGNHFRIAKYCQLPQSKMAEAVEYLVKLEMQEKKELPPSQPLFPSAIQSNIPGPQSGDKYHAYLEKVEKWRVATVAERENLYREGVALLDAGRLGGEMFHVCADYLSLWLKDGVLSANTSVFDELLRHNRAPVILAKFLNTNFESVEKHLK